MSKIVAPAFTALCAGFLSLYYTTFHLFSQVFSLKMTFCNVRAIGKAMNRLTTNRLEKTLASFKGVML